MFSGRLANKFHGTSKKGNDFFVLDIYVDTAPNNRVLFKSFVSPEIFGKVDNYPLDSSVVVKCGVNDYGKLVVSDISLSSK